MKASTKTQKQDVWKAHSEAWKASGKTQQAYCEHAGISYKRFVYHHKRLIRQLRKGTLSFIEAKAESAMPSLGCAGLQLILPNGIRIGINSEVNPIMLQTVLDVAGAV